jgi:Holliday junction resolvase RusA-like endonuclease
MKFFAPGVPRTKGSHIAFCPRRNQHHRGHSTPCRPFVTEDTRSDHAKRSRAWETAVRVASRAVAPPVPLDGPCRLSLDFYLPQPKSRMKEPRPVVLRADWEKYGRPVGDALQAETTEGYLVTNDNRFVSIRIEFWWADERGPGVEVEVTPLGAEQQALFGGRA